MGGCHLSARHRGRRDVEEEEEGGGEGKHDLAPMISTGAHPEVSNDICSHISSPSGEKSLLGLTEALVKK